LCLERPTPKLAVAGMQLLTATAFVFNTEEWPTSQGSKVCVSVWPLKAMVKVIQTLYSPEQAMRVPGR